MRVAQYTTTETPATFRKKNTSRADGERATPAGERSLHTVTAVRTRNEANTTSATRGPIVSRAPTEASIDHNATPPEAMNPPRCNESPTGTTRINATSTALNQYRRPWERKSAQLSTERIENP